MIEFDTFTGTEAVSEVKKTKRLVNLTLSLYKGRSAARALGLVTIITKNQRMIKTVIN